MSEHRHNPDQKAKLDDMLLGIPGVKASKGFGYPVYTVNGKIFVLVGSNGVAVKLPAPRVQKLIDHRTKHPFKVAEQIVWREWLSIQHADAEDYEGELELFQEALEYVASK
ncbi:MAG: hypothetical protein LCI00_32010 [Chloroflexi bacterium]|nr:hypothetical protein [Chloroflexota bacterium]MCC6894264.1 hypothetical protein [Anaerolineae bacterium]